MYNQNKEEVVMRYNAVNSDNKSWFSQARIIEAPWQDILTEQKNYFTVIGPCHGEGCRDFFINHFYGGCGADEGWFSVGDCSACRWENRFPAGVKLIYSKEATLTNYNTYSKSIFFVCMHYCGYTTPKSKFVSSASEYHAAMGP